MHWLWWNCNITGRKWSTGGIKELPQPIDSESFSAYYMPMQTTNRVYVYSVHCRFYNFKCNKMLLFLKLASDPSSRLNCFTIILEGSGMPWNIHCSGGMCASIFILTLLQVIWLLFLLKLNVSLPFQPSDPSLTQLVFASLNFFI